MLEGAEKYVSKKEVSLAKSLVLSKLKKRDFLSRF